MVSMLQRESHKTKWENQNLLPGWSEQQRLVYHSPIMTLPGKHWHFMSYCVTMEFLRPKVMPLIITLPVAYHVEYM